MAKRPLYAAAHVAASLAMAVLAVFPASAQTGTNRRQDVGCAACVAIAVDAQSAASLPEPLEGVEVFVRMPAGQEGEAASILNQSSAPTKRMMAMGTNGAS